MIRRSDITVKDALGTPNPGIYITVKDAAGNLASLFEDNGSVLGNPLVSGINGAFHYNISDSGAGPYFEEYRAALADSPLVKAITLGITGGADQALAALSSSTGSTMVGLLQTGTGAVARTVASKLIETASLKDFGAKGDGSTDDTTAIQAWINAGVSQGVALSAPAGTYIFTNPISHANPNGLVVDGAGSFATVFKYTGASTTADLFSLGTIGGSQTNNMSLSNFRIASGTTMTGGTGLHLKNVARSDLSGVIIDGQDGNGKLYNGIWFDQIDVVTFTNFIASASNDCLRVNGGLTGMKSDLFVDNGKICPSNGASSSCGVHVGGAFGGLYVGSVDVIGCGTNVIVDTALTAQSNREISFSALAALDTSLTGPALLLNDGGTGTVYISAAGAWFASAATHGVQINNTTCNYNIVIDGGRIYNNASDGIHNSSSLAQITIAGTEVRSNAGTGLANPGGGIIRAVNPRLSGNGADASGTVFIEGVPLFITVANGGNAVLNMNTGIVAVCLTNGGNGVAAYACGGGAASLLGTSSATWVASTTTPAAGKASVAYNGSAYAVYNNTGASVVFSYSTNVLSGGH